MPVNYVIEPEHRLVCMTATGKITTVHMLEFYRTLRADPGFRPEYDQIADFREAVPDGILGNQMGLSLDASPYLASSRRAYVVSPGLGYGMGRMASAFAEERRITSRLFDDVAEARRWLQVRPSP